MFSEQMFTSLNSWIWACSNMENTLEFAPSAALFLAFLGAFHTKTGEMKQQHKGLKMFNSIK